MVLSSPPAQASAPSSTPLAAQWALTRQKLERFRQILRDHRLDAWVLLSGDEHLNEYLPTARKRRDWLTGFTGSAGDVLITLDKAWLLVDPRYDEQADQQTDRADFDLIKAGRPQQPSLTDLVEQLPSGSRIGVDPFTVSVATYRQLAETCSAAGHECVASNLNPVDQLRSELEGSESLVLTANPVYPVPVEIAGASIADKVAQVRQRMQTKRIGILPVTKLDQVAWLFNLRGSDIPYNPVFRAYGVVSTTGVVLFTDGTRLTDEAVQSLAAAGVEIRPYEAYAATLQDWAEANPGETAGELVGIDPNHTTQGTMALLSALANSRSRDLAHPIEQLKACKNSTELVLMRLSNRQASRAKIRTLAWIQQQTEAGIPITEADVADQIQQFYQAEPHWRGLSFNTIAATGSNGSIVHYGTPDPQRVLQAGDLFLLDSGSQYWGGTTDDTRTVLVGLAQPTPEQTHRYTAVLKAHIDCISQIFPAGTWGSQLDGITRASMWRAGLDYGHGTGHGVGAFLNVHEGPNGIRKNASTPLEVGMINSVEPGFYQPGWGGIRLENLAEVAPAVEGWLRFESLTWIPFDLQLIHKPSLTPFQQNWLELYHHAVYEMMAPTLEGSELSWLKQACGLGA